MMIISATSRRPLLQRESNRDKYVMSGLPDRTQLDRPSCNRIGKVLGVPTKTGDILCIVSVG